MILLNLFQLKAVHALFKSANNLARSGTRASRRPSMNCARHSNHDARIKSVSHIFVCDSSTIFVWAQGSRRFNYSSNSSLNSRNCVSLQKIWLLSTSWNIIKRAMNGESLTLAEEEKVSSRTIGWDDRAKVNMETRRKRKPIDTRFPSSIIPSLALDTE